MNGSAPKSSRTGSHTSRQIKLKPNFRNVSVESLAITITIKTTKDAIAKANVSVVSLKTGSARRIGRRNLDGAVAMFVVTGLPHDSNLNEVACLDT